MSNRTLALPLPVYSEVCHIRQLVHDNEIDPLEADGIIQQLVDPYLPAGDPPGPGDTTEIILAPTTQIDFGRPN